MIVFEKRPSANMLHVSPLPFAFDLPGYAASALADNDGSIVGVALTGPFGNPDARAKRYADAINNHDALVYALRDVLDLMIFDGAPEDDPTLANARRVLAEAGR